MKQVEQHTIKPQHQWYSYCQEVTTISCKLFNTVQFNLRQSFFYGHALPSFSELDKLFKSDVNYKSLPAKVSQLVLKQSTDLWKAYQLSLRAYKEDSSNFTGKPKPRF